ncbi:unnamed protein product [Protopolystoma xenopodis]|uniref:Uncharacterized protein n=1 Tax=Protopolystoma xenopodis TaxID=117903 RepID=A0A3S4ZSA9_9PLAT|nr:unnamed protein product [Protopolystoma xenopodis]
MHCPLRVCHNPSSTFSTELKKSHFPAIFKDFDPTYYHSDVLDGASKIELLSDARQSNFDRQAKLMRTPNDITSPLATSSLASPVVPKNTCSRLMSETNYSNNCKQSFQKSTRTQPNRIQCSQKSQQENLNLFDSQHTPYGDTRMPMVHTSEGNNDVYGHALSSVNVSYFIYCVVFTGVIVENMAA